MHSKVKPVWIDRIFCSRCKLDSIFSLVKGRWLLGLLIMLQYVWLLNRYEDNLQQIYLISLIAYQAFANGSCLTFPKVYRSWPSRTVQRPLCALACQARPTDPWSWSLGWGKRGHCAVLQLASLTSSLAAVSPSSQHPLQLLPCPSRPAWEPGASPAESRLCCCLHGYEEKFKRNSGKRNVYRGEFFFSSFESFVILLKRTALNIKCFMAQKLFVPSFVFLRQLSRAYSNTSLAFSREWM